jgi:nitrate/nitrite-specific signal transduction histidine kinase
MNATKKITEKRPWLAWLLFFATVVIVVLVALQPILTPQKWISRPTNHAMKSGAKITRASFNRITELPTPLFKVSTTEV